MDEKKILLLGGGGHCRSVLDCLMSTGKYEEIGIIDYDKSASALGIDVVGTDDDLSRLLKEGWTDAFITVGSVGHTALRRKLFALIRELGFSIPFIIDPSAIIARGTVIGEGTFIGKRAVVNTGSIIGECAIINTGAIIEHDCKIDEFAHISPGSTLCGQVIVGKDSHIGAGSVVRQGICIGSNTIVGAGSVVVKDIPSEVTAFGNPCRVVE